eukprot:1158580-Pelagomonas_calceolata.AAC.21
MDVYVTFTPPPGSYILLLQAFSVWVHMCVVRLFVESILRYGLPPNFQVGHVGHVRGDYRWQGYKLQVRHTRGHKHAPWGRTRTHVVPTSAAKRQAPSCTRGGTGQGAMLCLHLLQRSRHHLAPGGAQDRVPCCAYTCCKEAGTSLHQGGHRTGCH